MGAFWAFALLAIWSLLSILRALQLAFSAIRLHGVARRAFVVSESLQPWLGEAESSRSGRDVEVCTTTELQVPSVVGFTRPRILLPPEVLYKSSPSDLRQILLHEASHLQRNDHWVNLLQKVGLVVFPLNPVLVWIERRLCAERELACDDAVLSLTGSRKAYAICLTNLAERSLLRRGFSLALGAWGRRSELTTRVHRILRAPGRKMRPVMSALAAAGLLTVVLGGAVSVTHLPPLVSFNSTSSLTKSAITERAAPLVPASTMAGPHMVLANAVMPGSRLASSRSSAKTSQKPRLIRAARRQHIRRAGPDVVLIGWRVAPSVNAFQLTLAREQPSYAAVAIRNGWMIFQL